MEYVLNGSRLSAFTEHLRREERAEGTIEKYNRDIRAFALYADGKTVTKEVVCGWKEHLRKTGYAPRTINSMLAAVHGLFSFLGWSGLETKYLKIQRRMFRDAGRNLMRNEYDRLVAAARECKKERIALIMEAICATGMRVSEVRYLTVEALDREKVEISLKGKFRTILLPSKLCRKLKKYARKQKITSGEIFLTKGGKPIGRTQIWAEMKKLCMCAKIETSKVFPHNLRHLFATTFYRVYKDIVRLADVLGHTSVDTTRIYLITAGEEHAKQIERLGLIT